jgi:sn-glycerol 3-phosphate transport system permease protein
MKGRIVTGLKPYIMVAPAMVGIIVFTVYPIYKLIALSFYNTNLLNASKTRFVGIENYVKVFARDAFGKSMVNTAIYSVFMILIVLSLSLILAVWLGRRKTPLNTGVQICIFTPHIISMVSVSLVWIWMMNPEFGLFNAVLRILGLPGSNWIRSSDTALGSIIFVAAWKSIGYYTLIFIAALQGIPLEIYEAAELDKAGKIRTFFKITLPIISPQIFFVLIIMTIGCFKVFETIRVMTTGGPNHATISIVYLIYEEVFSFSRIGYGAAVGVVLLVIVSLLVALYFLNLSKKVHYQ